MRRSTSSPSYMNWRKVHAYLYGTTPMTRATSAAQGRIASTTELSDVSVGDGSRLWCVTRWTASSQRQQESRQLLQGCWDEWYALHSNSGLLAGRTQRSMISESSAVTSRGVSTPTHR